MATFEVWVLTREKHYRLKIETFEIYQNCQSAVLQVNETNMFLYVLNPVAEMGRFIVTDINVVSCLNQHYT